jgi:hypothetical protein
LKIRVYWNDTDYSSDEEIKKDIQLGICHENTYFDDFTIPTGLNNQDANVFVCGLLYSRGLGPDITNHYWEVLGE